MRYVGTREKRDLSPVQSARRRTHRPEYSVWIHMVRRCRNAGAKDYPYYGARGITVCERWLDFAAFYADLGPRPSRSHTLDRIDNARGYEPGNVRWATRLEQQQNTRQARILEAFGRQQTLSAWAREIGVPAVTLRKRLKTQNPEAALMR